MVYCKDCVHAGWFEGSLFCGYRTRNRFNGEVEYKGKLEDNKDGNCPNFRLKVRSWWDKLCGY